MVLLPAVVFGTLIARAMRNDRMRTQFDTVERERQIVKLVEADLRNWLFAEAASDSAAANALLTFEVHEDRIVFPGFDLSLSPGDAPRQRPFESGPPTMPPTRQSIADQYFPRIVAFRRDLAGGRNAGTQYFPRLQALIVQSPGGARGYVVDIETVLAHVNGRLSDLSASEPFTGTGWIREARTSQPPAEGFTLEGFSFFDVLFSESRPGALARLRDKAFPYSMSLLVLVTIMGSVLVYRGISHEARLAGLRNDFVAAVSHEFRSPLSSILALAERIERVDDRDKLHEYHRIITQDARRLNALVTRLLDFALIEEGRKVYAAERVDLVAAAREAIDSCQHVMTTGRIRLRGAEAAPLWVDVDPNALHHAIQNVIENAAKYSPPESFIDVHCAAVNGSNLIEVQDRGIGIPAAEQTRIFEKFYRGRQVSGLSVQGVGIGLALVRHVMESHGGSVTVDSRPGEGSLFSLRLPKVDG